MLSGPSKTQADKDFQTAAKLCQCIEYLMAQYLQHDQTFAADMADRMYGKTPLMYAVDTMLYPAVEAFLGPFLDHKMMTELQQGQQERQQLPAQLQLNWRCHGVAPDAPFQGFTVMHFWCLAAAKWAERTAKKGFVPLQFSSSWCFSLQSK